MQARCRTGDVGGTALAAYMMRHLRFGEIDPLGPENVLIFASGPLTGANVPTSGRYAVIAKSPATGIWARPAAAAGSASRSSSWFRRAALRQLIHLLNTM